MIGCTILIGSDLDTTGICKGQEVTVGTPIIGRFAVSLYVTAQAEKIIFCIIIHRVGSTVIPVMAAALLQNGIARPIRRYRMIACREKISKGTNGTAHTGIFSWGTICISAQVKNRQTTN